MSGLLSIYGEAVAYTLNFVCVFGAIGALALAALNSDNWQFARKCLLTALIFAIVLTLSPPPEFFRAMR